MRIDSHQHFWKYDPGRHAWITEEMSAIRRDFLPSDLSPLLKSGAIDGCVTVQVDQSEEENHFLLALAGENPFIKGVVGWVDFRADDLDERLRHFRQFPKLKGFRHIVQGEPKGFLADEKFIRGVRNLARYDFTYDLLIYHHQLAEALAFAAQVRDVRIVVDHLAKPSVRTGEIAPWAAGMAALSDFENVHCKLSGMVTEARWADWKYGQLEPYIDAIFGKFGAGRIMYGSDWPVCLLAAAYDEQFAVVDRYLASLSEAERSLVLGENAERFYNL